MSLPQELYAHEVIRYLPVKDILSLCETSLTLSHICQEDATWKFLIGRDFGMVYEGENPREYYMKAKHIHEISDIPVEKLVGMDDFLRYLLARFGYGRNGNVYTLSHLPVEIVYSRLTDKIVSALYGLWGGVEDSFMVPIVNIGHQRDLTSILPPVFHYMGGNRIDSIAISLPDLVEIYEFYSGQSFWPGFVKVATNTGYNTRQEKDLINQILEIYRDSIYGKDKSKNHFIQSVQRLSRKY